MAVGHQALEQLPRLLPLQHDLFLDILHADIYLGLDIYIHLHLHSPSTDLYTSLVTKSLKD